MRARSFALRGALAIRVSFCFASLLSSLSLRRPIPTTFQSFYEICSVGLDFIASKAFPVLQPAYNTQRGILNAGKGKIKQFFENQVIVLGQISRKGPELTVSSLIPRILLY